jgi:hypothetical protein
LLAVSLSNVLPPRHNKIHPKPGQHTPPQLISATENSIMLNRCALIVRPKKPFLDWAAQLDDSGILPDPSGEQTVYLIPEYESDEQAQSILKRIYKEVFERQLDGWHTDQSAWPARRGLKTFYEWFTVELHSVIEDLCAHPLIDDDDEYYV